MMIKNTFYEAVMIIISAVVISLMVNALRPEGIDLFDHHKKEDQEKGENRFRIIGVEETIRKFKANEGIFVDARLPDAFFKGHIKNAVNLPDHQFDEWIEEFIAKNGPQTEIITYCDGVGCSQAKDLAEKLCLIGFENVSYFPEGYDAWVERHMEIQGDLDSATRR